ncbi:hypothetical protein GCM10023093_31490 [Nemorincola caseinilytica]|uniref:Uncharacterized protein n=1 Tax=Nemorincola caseinilytica TaxID=2054315 RepID=A0ABP8NS01_9BACT
MNKWLLISVFCFGSTVCAAQDEQVLSHIPAIGSAIKAFIPKGYDSVYSARGDMNKDGLEDVAIVLAKTVQEPGDENVNDDPAKDADEGYRYLVVLLRTANGWKLGGKSATAVYCRTCGGVFGDPFESITIKKGVMVIEHYGGSHTRWAVTTRFQYRGDAFYLIGRTDANMESTWDCDEQPIELTDTNLLTGERYRKTVTRECKHVLDKKDRVPKSPLVRLEDVKE